MPTTGWDTATKSGSPASQPGTWEDSVEAQPQPCMCHWCSQSRTWGERVACATSGTAYAWAGHHQLPVVAWLLWALWVQLSLGGHSPSPKGRGVLP